MKCDRCGKKATVYVSERQRDKVISRHLCEDCARTEGDLASIKSEGTSAMTCDRCGGIATARVTDGRSRSESHLCDKCAAETVPQYAEQIQGGKIDVTALIRFTEALMAETETFRAALKEYAIRTGRAPHADTARAIECAAKQFVQANGRAANGDEIAEVLQAVMSAKGDDPK